MTFDPAAAARELVETLFESSEITWWGKRRIEADEVRRQLTALAARAYAAGVAQRLEDLDLIKDGVCLCCGADEARVAMLTAALAELAYAEEDECVRCARPRGAPHGRDGLGDPCAIGAALDAARGT